MSVRALGVSTSAAPRRSVLSSSARAPERGATVAGAVDVESLERTKRAPGLVRGEQLSAVERSPSFDAAVKRTSFDVVRIAGESVDVLLPSAGPGQDSFREYVRRLAKTCSFPDQKEAIRALEKASTVTTLPLEHDRRPVVGILLSQPEQLLAAFNGSESSKALVAAVEAMGCRPVLVPPRADLLLPNDRTLRWAGITALVSKLDGIAGPGGADVHPRLYGQVNRWSVETNYPRDRFEADVAMVALRSDVYMLGICRSHQLWNAATGGALVQDVRKQGYSSISQNQDDFGIPMDQPFVVKDPQGKLVFENRVRLEKKSRMRTLVGRDSVLTNSFHHQAVARPGAPFEVVGAVRDPKTGKTTIEACEAPNALTVQWHPELGMSKSASDRAIVESFGRRVHVFRALRELRAEGGAGVEELLQRVKARGVELSAADIAWVRTDLAPSRETHVRYAT